MKITIECSRCTKGFIRLFSQIEGGICFTCKGTGLVKVEKEVMTHFNPIVMKCFIEQSKILDEIGKLTEYMGGYDTSHRILEGQLTKTNNRINELRLLAGDEILDACWTKVYDKY